MNSETEDGPGETAPDCEEEKRKAVQLLNRLLAEYYVALINSGNDQPKTKCEFIKKPENTPQEIKKLLCKIEDADDKLARLFGDTQEAGENIVRDSNYDRTGFPLDVGDVEHRVGALAEKLGNHNKKLTENLKDKKVYPDEVAEIFGLYIQASLKCTVYILSEGIKFIQTQKNLEESHRRRWLILRGIKGVYLYYVRAYLEWGIKVDVIPDRAPSRALQMIAFKGYDFDGLLKNLGLDLSVKNSLRCPDPADPVNLYAEILWNCVLVSLGYYLFPDTPHSKGPKPGQALWEDCESSDQPNSDDRTQSNNTPCPPSKEEEETPPPQEPTGNGSRDLGLEGVDDLLDSETNEFIDEIYDAFYNAVGLTPLDSALELANRLKKRFVDSI